MGTTAMIIMIKNILMMITTTEAMTIILTAMIMRKTMDTEATNTNMSILKATNTNMSILKATNTNMSILKATNTNMSILKATNTNMSILKATNTNMSILKAMKTDTNTDMSTPKVMTIQTNTVTDMITKRKKIIVMIMSTKKGMSYLNGRREHSSPVILTQWQLHSVVHGTQRQQSVQRMTRWRNRWHFVFM